MDHNTFTLRENIHQLPSVLVTKVFLGVALQVHLGGRVSKWRKRGELSCSWLDGLLLGPTGLCHDLLLLCVGGDSDLLVPAFLLMYSTQPFLETWKVHCSTTPGPACRPS